MQKQMAKAVLYQARHEHLNLEIFCRFPERFRTQMAKADGRLALKDKQGARYFAAFQYPRNQMAKADGH
ncbi:MAG: hypothetical protein CME82_01580 [Halomonas sp.]|nr:hypothetical protein [Halomonas sp.]